MPARLLLSAIVIFTVATGLYAQEPSFLSAIQGGGPLTDAGQAVTVDPSGNAVVTGYFRETSTFGGLEVTSSGIDDIFVAKFDAEGNGVWVVSAGGTDADEGRGIAVDADGNVFATGRFFDRANFGSTELVSAAGWDAFLVKYDPNGNLLWVESIGGGAIDEGFDVDVDAAGNVYVTGSFADQATVGDSTFTSAGQEDMFLAKYDPDGNFIWAARAGDQFFDQGHGVGVDDDGNAYVSGRFSGMVTFADTTLFSNRLFNSYLAKYDANGNFQWVRKGGGRDDFSYGVDVDGFGNPVSVGYFQENAVFGDSALASFGSSDMYVAKYDPAGDLLWVVQGGSTDSDFGYAVAAGDDGSVLATGFYTGTATFGDTTLTSTAFKEVFFVKYDSDGNFMWAASAGGGDLEEGLGIAFDASGNMIATGFFHETASFGDFELTASPTGESDMFLTTFGVDGGDPTSVEEIPDASSGRGLGQNYPNPFSDRTTIPVDLDQPAVVRMTLHDVLGREVLVVADETIPVGGREFQLDATDIPPGVYLIRAEIGSATYVRTVSIIR